MIKRRILVGAMLGVCVAVAGCNDEVAAPQPVRPVLSTVVTPVQTEGGVVVGTVEPRFKTDLSFRVQGRLIARPFYIGDTVDKGQTVAAIDPTSLELAVRSAVADLAASQAKLTNATGFEERQRTLLKTQVISQSEMESAEQSTASAFRKLENAIMRIRIVAAAAKQRIRGRGTVAAIEPEK